MAVVGALFLLTPIVAIKNRLELKEVLARLDTDLFTHTVCFFVACIPVWIAWSFVRKAALMTFEVYSAGDLPSSHGATGLFYADPFCLSCRHGVSSDLFFQLCS